jgi:hypothetical protein
MIKILCNRIKKKIRKRKRKNLALKAEVYVYLRKIINLDYFLRVSTHTNTLKTL